MRKRMLSFILVLCMVCTLLPFGAFAVSIVKSGTCDDGLKWSLDSAGKLTISGTGAMKDYAITESGDRCITTAPWGSYAPQIKSVDIKNGVGSIGDYAFLYCSNLTSVTIPDGVTIIGDNAFYNCSSLISVTIPDSVTSIEWWAFYGCSGLTSVTIPDSVTSIKRDAFYRCSNLVSFNVAADNPVYSENGGLICSKDKSVLLICPPGLEGTLIIPDGITTIGNLAFSGCSKLTSITLNGDVDSILAGETFSGCMALKSIFVADDNETYCSIDGVLYNASKTTLIQCPVARAEPVDIYNGTVSVGHYAFYYCTEVPEVNIPSSVKTIGEYAFYNCNSMTSVTIPDSVRRIEEGTFCNCTSLTSVTISDSVTSIWNNAFYDCTSLVSFNVAAGNPVYSECNGLICSKDKSMLFLCPPGIEGDFVVPDGITSIGDNAFSGSSKLTSITLNSDVDSILAGETFSGCTALKSIFVADGNEALCSIDGVLYNASKTTLIQCPGSMSEPVNIYNGTTAIGKYAFYACDQVQEVNIPGSVKNIGEYAFYFCENLRCLTLPYGVVSIGNNAFGYCRRLGSVTLPDSVISIGNNAFFHCDSFTYIVVPGSVKTIGSYGVFCNDDCDIYYEYSKNEWDNLFPDYEASVDLLHHFNCTEPDGHWTDIYITAPTCTKAGTVTSKCPCGHEKTEHEVPAPGHNYINGVCNRCGSAENPFVDLKAGEYYIDPVLWAANFEPVPITGGVDPAHFAPDSGCTRGQVVTFLWRAAYCPEPTTAVNPFVDVQNSGACQPFYKAILWAAEKGITNGTDPTHFSPNAYVTRAQVVTFLHRYAGKPGPSSARNPFVDLKAGEYYIYPILWAAENGITNGVDPTHFAPNTTVTRAQVVTFLYRYAV